MATIDLTLDALKIPNINGTFPFGKKITQTELNHGGLSTTEVNSNVMLPFTQMRPKICDEDSDTSQVEYDAKVVFNAPQGTTPAAGYTLTMGNGTYVGCTVTYTNLMEYACTVMQSDGTTTLFSVPAGKTLSAMWNGTAWLWTTTGSVTANDPTPVSSAAVHAAIAGLLSPTGLIQWGKATMPNNNYQSGAYIDISLTKPFSNTNYTILYSRTSYNNYGSTNIVYSGKTKNGFRIEEWNDNQSFERPAHEVCWVAIGT